MKSIYIEKDTKEYVIKIIGNGYVGRLGKMNVPLREALKYKTREAANKKVLKGQIVLTVKSQLEE